VTFSRVILDGERQLGLNLGLVFPGDIHGFSSDPGDRRLGGKANRKMKSGRRVVGLGRVELPANGLGNRCSIHLSYRPVSFTRFYTDSAEKPFAFNCAGRELRTN
jgi:hypothetical protein